MHLSRSNFKRLSCSFDDGASDSPVVPRFEIQNDRNEVFNVNGVVSMLLEHDWTEVGLRGGGTLPKNLIDLLSLG